MRELVDDRHPSLFFGVPLHAGEDLRMPFVRPLEVEHVATRGDCRAVRRFPKFVTFFLKTVFFSRLIVV